jgi:hypothetical protein
MYDLLSLLKRLTSQSLPFGNDVDIALGIAVKTYLDDHCDPNSSKDYKEAEKQRYADALLPNAENFPRDINAAFNFFNALYEGVSQLGSEISDQDREVWRGADKYLRDRR